MTVRQIDQVGRRIVQLGGVPALPWGRGNRISSRPKPGEALAWESRLLAGLRSLLQALAAGGDWASEDLVRRILMERESLLCRFQTLDYDNLELVLDDDPLSMEEGQRPVQPIH
jgi:bacterioferritin (cytochrome b1)